MMLWKVWLTLGVLAFVVGAVAVHNSSRKRILKKEFQTASVGSGMTGVTDELGKPWRTGPCGSNFSAKTPQACDKEIVYAVPFAPLVPEYWVFYYDHDGKLIDKRHLVSP
jgi:hypothetical protein